jgi:hypothetical protein
MPSVMPPSATIMPNYAELCYYADYATPMQLCRFIMLASRGMPNRSSYSRSTTTAHIIVGGKLVNLNLSPRRSAELRRIRDNHAHNTRKHHKKPNQHTV